MVGFVLTAHAALLIDRGDQRWAVLSDERGLPAPQAPVS
jgi:hypothetical protein